MRLKLAMHGAGGVGGDPCARAAGLIDHSVYWTENHQVTYYTLKYLAGTMFPDTVFGSDGQLGATHKARAELALHRWLERKGRLGFSEWHSNVYYAASLQPFLLLVDFADDPDIATRAAMVVDLLVLDLALNTYESTFGASHGRSRDGVRVARLSFRQSRRARHRAFD